MSNAFSRFTSESWNINMSRHRISCPQAAHQASAYALKQIPALNAYIDNSSLGERHGKPVRK